MSRSACLRRLAIAFAVLAFQIVLSGQPAMAAENPVGRFFERLGKALTPEAPRRRPVRRGQRSPRAEKVAARPSAKPAAALPVLAPLPPEKPEIARSMAATPEPDKKAGMGAESQGPQPPPPPDVQAAREAEIPLPPDKPAALRESQPSETAPAQPPVAAPLPPIKPVPIEARAPAPKMAAATPVASIVGESGCGIAEPFKLDAVGPDKRTALSPPPMLNPAMVETLVRFEDELQALAQKHFNEPLARIDVAASYVCRPINGVKTARLSEHAKGNAVDIGAFTLKGGRSISVERDWRGGEETAKAFLQEVRASACRLFVVVLTPDGDAMHQNHMHLDLGRSRICQ